MDIIEAATVLSDTVFTATDKRSVKVVDGRVTVKGTVDGTATKAKVAITIQDSDMHLGVWMDKKTKVLSVAKPTAMMDAKTMTDFGKGLVLAFQKSTPTR